MSIFIKHSVADLLNEKIPATAILKLSKNDIQSEHGTSFFWCNASSYVTSFESQFLMEFKNGSLIHLRTGT